MGGDAMRIAGYPLPVYPDSKATVSQIGSRVSRKPLPAQRREGYARAGEWALVFRGNRSRPRGYPGRGSEWRGQVYPRTLRTAAINCSGVTGLASVEFAPKRFATFRNPPPKAPHIAMIDRESTR